MLARSRTPRPSTTHPSEDAGHWRPLESCSRIRGLEREQAQGGSKAPHFGLMCCSGADPFGQGGHDSTSAPDAAGEVRITPIDAARDYRDCDSCTIDSMDDRGPLVLADRRSLVEDGEPLWADKASASDSQPHLSSRPVASRPGHKVWLHVYDLDTVTQRLNQYVLKAVSLGAFHVGVEILGEEWFFAWGDTDHSGVVWNTPRSHQVHIYRESLCMGDSPLSEDEIEQVICTVMDDWPGNSYHPISRNCITFAEELVRLLQVPEPFPAWVRGVADAGRSAILFPIADFGWQWIKWYCKSDQDPNASHVYPLLDEDARLQDQCSTAQFGDVTEEGGSAGIRAHDGVLRREIGGNCRQAADNPEEFEACVNRVHSAVSQ